jgi:hypothetical protein
MRPVSAVAVRRFPNPASHHPKHPGDPSKKYPITPVLSIELYNKVFMLK